MTDEQLKAKIKQININLMNDGFTPDEAMKIFQVLLMNHLSGNASQNKNSYQMIQDAYFDMEKSTIEAMLMHKEANK